MKETETRSDCTGRWKLLGRWCGWERAKSISRSSSADRGYVRFSPTFLKTYPPTRIPPSLLLIWRSGGLRVEVRGVNDTCTKFKQRKDPQSGHHVQGAGQSTKHSVSPPRTAQVPCPFTGLWVSAQALDREGENCFDWNLTAGLKVGFIPNPRSGWKNRGAGIFAGQVLVALSWPLLSPHPLPPISVQGKGCGGLCWGNGGRGGGGEALVSKVERV